MNNQNQRDINTLIQQGYTLDVSGSIQRGWEILNRNLGGFIGFLLLTFLLGFLSICLCFIPLLFAGNLYAGFLIVSMRISKNRPVVFNDFFGGFKNSNFPQILLATLVIGLMTSLAYLPVNIIQMFYEFDSSKISRVNAS